MSKHKSSEEERARYWMERNKRDYLAYMNAPPTRAEIQQQLDQLRYDVQANGLSLEILGLYLAQKLEFKIDDFRAFAEAKMKEIAEQAMNPPAAPGAEGPEPPPSNVAEVPHGTVEVDHPGACAECPPLPSEGEPRIIVTDPEL